MIPSAFSRAFRRFLNQHQRLASAGAHAQKRRKRFQPRLEVLEDRTLLDAGPLAHPAAIAYHAPGALNPLQFPSPVGYQPAQIRKAYGIDSISVSGIIGDGTGQTVAIVDA